MASQSVIIPLVCQASESKDPQDTGDLTEPITMQTSGIVRVSPKESKHEKTKTTIEVLHSDIIGDGFWDARPYLLGH